MRRREKAVADRKWSEGGGGGGRCVCECGGDQINQIQQKNLGDIPNKKLKNV